MQSQSGTSQVLGVVALLFGSAGAFTIQASYGAIVVARLSVGKYQFQLNTGVNDNNIAPIVTQFGTSLKMVVTFNPATLATGISNAANTIEIDFGGSGTTDPSFGNTINVIFQTCFDVIDNTP